MARPLKTNEIEEMIMEDSFSESGGSDDVYCPSSDEESEVQSQCEEVTSDESEIEDDTVEDDGLTVHLEIVPDEEQRSVVAPNLTPENTVNIWTDPQANFIPRKVISIDRKCIMSSKISRYCSELDLFLKLMPISVFKYIAQCTNERLEIHRSKKKISSRSLPNTDSGEIMIVLGCTFIMCYNHVPAMSDYWSKNKSMKNEAIKEAITRDRFKLLMGKMYYAPVEHAMNAPKTYYIDDIVNCFKKTFREMRQDSPFQSVDESMTKFLGRSTMKQYMPLKPVKRGIKIWMRCDSKSGYTYDFNIYSGKETESVEGTLGERVVNKLASTIIEPDVTLCFDRFFTSVHLINQINYAAIGTCISNRRELPKITEKLERGEYIFKCNQYGAVCVKWQDTKEVLVLSNCHTNTVGTVERKMKDGNRLEVSCPEMIKCYRYIMGGVDLADKMIGVYDLDRKSTKWWKKVFFRLLMTCAVNSWILHSELHREKRPFKNFVVELSEQLINKGRETAAVKRTRRDGRNSKRAKLSTNIGDHLPIQGTMRRRCEGCKRKGKESRTKQMCKACDLAFCKNCFTPCHT